MASAALDTVDGSQSSDDASSEEESDTEKGIESGSKAEVGPRRRKGDVIAQAREEIARREAEREREALAGGE